MKTYWPVIFILLFFVSCGKNKNKKEYLCSVFANSGRYEYDEKVELVEKVWSICEKIDSTHIVQTIYDANGKRKYDFCFLKKGKIYYKKEHPFVLKEENDDANKSAEIIWTKFADFSDYSDTPCWNTLEAKIGNGDILFINTKREMCVERIISFNTKNEKIPAVLISYFQGETNSYPKHYFLFSEKYGIVKQVLFNNNKKIFYMFSMVE